MQVQLITARGNWASVRIRKGPERAYRNLAVRLEQSKS